MLWVHVTLLESMVIANDALLSPLSADERDAYCAESAWVPVALRAREEDVPRDLAAAQDSTFCDAFRPRERWRWAGRPRRGAGRALAALGPLAMPLAAFVRFLTRAWLPETVRRLYGLSWTEADARRLPRVLAIAAGGGGGWRAARRLGAAGSSALTRSAA